MSNSPNNYQRLGVARDASHEEIRSAFRRLAAIYHPDHCGGHPISVRRFQWLSEAYEILSDPRKRRRYDLQLGSLTATNRLTSRVENLLEDLIDNMFYRPGSEPSKAGRNLRCTLPLRFEQAALGGTFGLRVTIPSPCAHCKATGAEVGSPAIACHVCTPTRIRQASGGLPPARRACPFCMGRGVVHPVLCKSCHGSAIVNVYQDVYVSVPPGSEDGHQVVLRGLGSASRNHGPRGNLIVDLSVQPHPLLQRRGVDLHMTVPVSPTEAVLGTTLVVPTLESLVRVTVSPLSSTEQTLKLPGRGIPRPGGERGDQYLHLFVELPVALDAAARNLFERLAQATHGRHFPRRAAFRQTIRQIWQPNKTTEEGPCHENEPVSSS